MNDYLFIFLALKLIKKGEYDLPRLERGREIYLDKDIINTLGKNVIIELLYFCGRKGKTYLLMSSKGEVVGKFVASKDFNNDIDLLWLYLLAAPNESIKDVEKVLTILKLVKNVLKNDVTLNFHIGHCIVTKEIEERIHSSEELIDIFSYMEISSENTQARVRDERGITALKVTFGRDVKRKALLTHPRNINEYTNEETTMSTENENEIDTNETNNVNTETVTTTSNDNQVVNEVNETVNGEDTNVDDEIIIRILTVVNKAVDMTPDEHKENVKSSLLDLTYLALISPEQVNHLIKFMEMAVTKPNVMPLIIKHLVKYIKMKDMPRQQLLFTFQELMCDIVVINCKDVKNFSTGVISCFSKASAEIGSICEYWINIDRYKMFVEYPTQHQEPRYPQQTMPQQSSFWNTSSYPYQQPPQPQHQQFGYQHQQQLNGNYFGYQPNNNQTQSITTSFKKIGSDICHPFSISVKTYEAIIDGNIHFLVNQL